MKKTLAAGISVVGILVFLAIGFLIGYNTHKVIINSSGSNAEVRRALCVINNSTVNGVINLVELGTGLINIYGNLSAPEGAHGFHIHNMGNLGDGCKATGPHYNPFALSHGAPDVAERHVGDLGNIITESQRAVFNITDKMVTLNGETSVIGRSFVVHERIDDLGVNPDNGSRTTGNAGGRIGCCVIAINASS